LGNALFWSEVQTPTDARSAQLGPEMLEWFSNAGAAPAPAAAAPAPPPGPAPEEDGPADTEKRSPTPPLWNAERAPSALGRVGDEELKENRGGLPPDKAGGGARKRGVFIALLACGCMRPSAGVTEGSEASTAASSSTASSTNSASNTSPATSPNKSPAKESTDSMTSGSSSFRRYASKKQRDKSKSLLSEFEGGSFKPKRAGGGVTQQIRRVSRLVFGGGDLGDESITAPSAIAKV
jgi:hypothetical protein